MESGVSTALGRESRQAKIGLGVARCRPTISVSRVAERSVASSAARFVCARHGTCAFITNCTQIIQRVQVPYGRVGEAHQ